MRRILSFLLIVLAWPVAAALPIDLVKWLLDARRGPKTARRTAAASRASSAETDATLAKYLRARRKRIEAGPIEAGAIEAGP